MGKSEFSTSFKVSSGSKKSSNEQLIKEEDIIDEINIPPVSDEIANRFILAKYFIIGYLLLIAITIIGKIFQPTLDTTEIFSILEKLGYVIAAIIGFYFTSK